MIRRVALLVAVAAATASGALACTFLVDDGDLASESAASDGGTNDVTPGSLDAGGGDARTDATSTLVDAKGPGDRCPPPGDDQPCEDGGISWRGRCYWQPMVGTSRITEASATCAQAGAHMVTITCEDEWLAVRSILGRYDTSWIGAERVGGEWRWRTGEAFTFFRRGHRGIP